MYIFMNVLIILFIVGMAYWWGLQGFFSGFLHLVCVVAAGALAFALWEPIAQGLLMRGTAAHYAWCLGLILPFILLLLTLRLTLDRLVRKNMYFSLPVNRAGGGLCGAAAGYLTAGIAIIGLINLPWGINMGGYQPYQIRQGAAEGNLVEVNSAQAFWVSPEKGTASFFQTVSDKAFSSERPLSDYRPQPVVAAVVNRLRLDDEASIVALPETVSAERYYIEGAGKLKELGVDHGAVDSLLASQPSGGQLIAVQVDFSGAPVGTFDNDQALRIAPTQVQLWGHGGENPQFPLIPVGVTKMHDENPKLHIIEKPLEFFASTTGSSQYMWFYAAPAGFEPTVLLVRNTRLTLTPEDKSDELHTLASAMDYDPIIIIKDEEKITDVPTLQPMPGNVTNYVARTHQLTDALPQTFSPNFAQGQLNKDEEGRIIYARGVTVRKQTGFQNDKIAAKRVAIPQHQQAVRIELDRGGARSVLGAALAIAGVQVAYLEDSKGDQYFPIGYVWMKGDGSMQLQIDRDNPIRAAQDVPVRDMNEGDTMYLYYSVERGVTLTQFVATPQNIQKWLPELNLP